MQKTVLPVPRFSLQVAVLEQVAEDRAPALSSHFDVEMQLIMLPSPPLPLHSELSLQMSVVGPSDTALHFAPVSHRRAQPASLHVVLQSGPAVHAQLLS
jgi:hypothetical protein